jgi:hypothetical protein
MELRVTRIAERRHNAIWQSTTIDPSGNPCAERSACVNPLAQ